MPDPKHAYKTLHACFVKWHIVGWPCFVIKQRRGCVVGLRGIRNNVQSVYCLPWIVTHGLGGRLANLNGQAEGSTKEMG